MNYRDRRCIARVPLLGQSKTISYLFGPTDALFAVSSFLCLFSEQALLVRLGYHGTLFYLCLANHSAVSKRHPAEGAEIYSGCGIPGCCKVCCAVCTPLCGVVVQPTCLCCSLFFCCRDFAFSNVHDIFSEMNKTRTSTSIHPIAYDPCVPCLEKIQAARGSLYSTHTNTVQLSSPSRSICGVNSSTTWHCL